MADKKPEMIMTVGIPGCGKSFYAKELSKNGYKVFSSDEIREKYSLYGNENNAKVFNILHRGIKEALRDGYNCVYDATNMSRKNRMAFLQELTHIECKKTCALFIVPIEECKKRNNNREGLSKVPEDVYDKMLKSFNIPCEYEGFDEILCHFDGFKEEYKSNYDFDNMDLDSLHQDNSHHDLSLGEHMSKAEEYVDMLDISNDEEKDILKKAAKYHDIGKLYTKTFVNFKGEESKDAHFYGHECFGAYLYLVMAKYNDYKDNNLIKNLYISNLINWHMIKFVWRQSEKIKNRHMELLSSYNFSGNESNMYDHLQIIFNADEYGHGKEEDKEIDL